jgi:hypothetical protein
VPPITSRCCMLLAAAFALALPTVTVSAPVIFSDSGSNSAAIQDTVDSFRSALGTLNPNVVGSFGSGRREINWDGVPAALSAPNNLPANFFNSNSPRGVVFSTPGSGFQVSGNAADVGNPPVEFGNIDPIYPTFFAPFSSPRLFTALGSTLTTVDFFVPGSNTTALVSGFGVVFSDVDQANTTSIQYFDRNNSSLGTFFAPSFAGNETFSFLGVQFTEGAVVSRVTITSGNQVLAAGNSTLDSVVMDDFIYSEPVVPEPTSLVLFGSGTLGLLAVARWRRGRAA